MSNSCESCRRLRHERSRHLVLIFSLVDFLQRTKEVIGATRTSDLPTSLPIVYRRLVSQASRLIGLCKNELAEAQEERSRRSGSPYVAAALGELELRQRAALELGLNGSSPEVALDVLDVLARGGGR